MWTGTVGDGQVDLFLTPPAGAPGVTPIARHWLIKTPMDFFFQIDLWLMLEGKDDEGCRFVTNVPAGVAGDKLIQSLHYLANKIW
jgi:hypothetical protein